MNINFTPETARRVVEGLMYELRWEKSGIWKTEMGSILVNISVQITVLSDEPK